MLEIQSFPLTTTQTAPIFICHPISGRSDFKIRSAFQRLQFRKNQLYDKNDNFNSTITREKPKRIDIRCASQVYLRKPNKKQAFLGHNVDESFMNGRICLQMQEKVNVWISDSLFQKLWGLCDSLCISVFFVGSIMLLGFSCNSAFADPMMDPHVIHMNNEVELLPIPEIFPPLKDFPLPTFEKVVLPNGLHVFLLEDHELGLVGGQILARGGSKADPLGKVGLATISSFVQRSGGTVQHPGEALDMKLEEIAARIETSSGVSEMSVGFRCLSEDLKEVMRLFFEVIQNPLMPKDKLDFVRTQLLSSIERRGDNPGGIASREFSKILYGDKSVYARYFTEDSLNSINQEDLVAFQKAIFSPKSSVLGIWGDFDSKVVKDIIVRDLSSWNAVSDADSNQIKYREADVLSQELEPGISNYKPDIYVVDKPGLTQGFVRMGELGTTIVDPDVFSLDVLNEILNGFGGLLFDQIRSKEGLAYSVYGGWTPAVEHRGSFLAGGETQITTVPQFINSVERVLQNVTQQPPSEETLNKAKESIINSFVFNFADSGIQLSRLMTYDLFGIDQNYIYDFKKRVTELTSTDILEAAKHHLHPGAQPVLVVVDASKLSSSLQNLGKQVVIVHPDYLP